MKNYLLCFFILILQGRIYMAKGQVTDSTYIYNQDSVFVFGNDTISNWGDLFNNGSLGSDTLSVLVQFGEVWKNSITSRLPDIKHGGTFFFVAPRPLPYANNSVQKLVGGFDVNAYTGCTFPNVLLHNDNNLKLESNDFKTKYIFKFDTGHVMLSGNNMIVGDGNPGLIDGYCQTRFVVNDSGVAGGCLYREGIKNTSGLVAFPVGSAIGDYTPAAIFNLGATDTFSVRVFNNVYQQGTSGNIENNLTVAKTWDVKEHTAGGSNVRLFLEHKNISEGSSYNRNNQFISRYIGQVNNSFGGAASQNSYWDLISSNNCLANTSPGMITNYTPIANSYDVYRNFNHDSDFNVFHYFTKTVCAVPLPLNMLTFETQWYHENRQAKLKWQTLDEINTAGFWVERQLINENGFSRIGWVPSSSSHNNSMNDYTFIDRYQEALFNYSGMAFYRLKMMDENSQFTYTDIHAINIKSNISTDIKVWPNPTMGAIQIEVKNNQTGMAYIYDMSGKLILTKSIQPRVDGNIDLTGLPAGVYILIVEDATERYKPIKVQKL